MSADDSPSPSCSSIASMASLSESSGIITSSASAKLSCSSYSADCGHILKSVEDGCLCSLCGCNSSVVERCVICGQTWCYCNECQIQLSEKHKQAKSTEPMDCESKPYLQTRFLHFGSTRPSYVAFGNTEAQDLLEHVGFDNGINEDSPAVLSLGWYVDICSCCYTLWKHFYPPGLISTTAHCSCPGVRFVLNDISKVMVARNILFLYLTMKSPPWTQREAIKQWISSMWAIWYCHELLPIHKETLEEALDALVSFSDTMESWGGVKENPLRNVVTVTDQSTLSKVREVWRMWRTSKFGSVKEVLTERAKKLPAPFIAQEGLPPFLMFAVDWLKKTDQFASKGMQDAVTADYIHYVKNGSFFAEECLNIPHLCTSSSVANPTIFEHESGEYTLQTTVLPFRSFHHGLIVTESNLSRFGVSHEFAGLSLPLLVEDKSFQSHPILSNSVQQFSIWVFSTAAILKSSGSKADPDITFTFNWSDSVQFCEQLQIKPTSGVLPSHFDAIYTSNLIDRKSPPVILNATKSLLKNNGHLVAMTMVYRQTAASGEEYLEDVFGYSPELLPVLMGMRCIGHDGVYTDQTSAVPAPVLAKEALIQDFSRSRFDKVFVWQRINACPLKISALEKNMILTYTLYVAISNCILARQEKENSPVCNIVMCTETAISVILSFVSQLDADVDISAHTFWDGLCALIQGNKALRRFLVHIQTQALLHGLHFHLTLTETDCPICLKEEPLKKFVTRFFIEFEPLSSTHMYEGSPTIFLSIHNSSTSPAFLFLDKFHSDPRDEVHFVDSAQGQKLSGEKLRLDFFFPTSYALRGYYFTVFQDFTFKIGGQSAGSSNPRVTKLLRFCRVPNDCESFVFRQVDTVHTTRCLSTNLGSVLSHVGDGKKSKTTLSIAPESLSVLKSKTASITLKHPSLSTVQVVCDKNTFTMTYPYPINKSNIKTKVSLTKGTIQIVAQHDNYHVYDERKVCFVGPNHLMTVPSLKFDRSEFVNLFTSQLTKEEELSIYMNSRSPVCNAKLSLISCFHLESNCIRLASRSSVDEFGLSRTMGYVLINRRAADVARYSPVLDVYYILYDETEIVFEEFKDRWTMMRQDMASNCSQIKLEDNEWPVLKKILEYFASRTRPSISHSRSSIASLLSKHSLEQYFTRAVLYPLYCDQDFVRDVHQSEKDMLSLFTSCPWLDISTTPNATAASASLSSSFRSARPKTLEYHTECSYCGTKSSKLKKCTRCKRTSYCGKQCQTKHWKDHKSVCKTKPDPLTKCSNCDKESSKLKHCAACQVVAYCSKECQRNDWARHKSDCAKK